jgi:putative transposase
MDLPRSTYYAAPKLRPSNEAVVAEMRAITDAFECYGYRRVGAALRHRGLVVNAKKVRRLMREHDLNPRRRRRFTRTTDSDHDAPIYPFVARDFEVHGPDQLWVADLTYVAIATGFVYVAVVLDAWSRRVVGYSIGRSLDARHAVAALQRAITLQRPLPGCVFHSDRGSQGGLNRSSQHFDGGGCDDDGEEALGPIHTEGHALAWTTACGAARAPTGVLVSRRGRALERGCCG